MGSSLFRRQCGRNSLGFDASVLRYASMAKLVYAPASKVGVRKGLLVRLQLLAPWKSKPMVGDGTRLEIERA